MKVMWNIWNFLSSLFFIKMSNLVVIVFQTPVDIDEGSWIIWMLKTRINLFKLGNKNSILKILNFLKIPHPTNKIKTIHSFNYRYHLHLSFQNPTNMSLCHLEVEQSDKLPHVVIHTSNWLMLSVMPNQEC